MSIINSYYSRKAECTQVLGETKVGATPVGWLLAWLGDCWLLLLLLLPNLLQMPALP
jgi:hypothetical protein